MVNQHFIDSYTEKYEEFKTHVENRLDMNELETLDRCFKELKLRKAAIAYASAERAWNFTVWELQSIFKGVKL